MAPLHLSLLIHAHQPMGNFEHVQEEVYQLSYLPFVETLEQHPRVRMALHYSGILLAWLERHHPEYVEKLRNLAHCGRIELLGGGFYEPILGSIPDRDRLAQIERLSDFIEQHFGRRPRGAWLTERVWEPTLPRVLAQAGVEYTLTDDYHFLSVGLETDQLYGYYLTEWQGSVVKVIPGQKSLRYLLPFRAEGDAISYLQAIAQKHAGGMVAMGDDLEKFGAWPETYQHVYKNGWLKRFFEALENASEWLATTLPSDYVAANKPLGRIYLPTASYQEMMGWALPPGAAGQYEELIHRVEHMPDSAALGRFVHGGVWQNFFYKYDEANHLHKRMLDLSRRYEELDRSLPRGTEARRTYDQGYESLLSGQCNDAYWHGVFGGLYAPHLRTSVYQGLLQAENIAQKLELAPRIARRLDLNVDGVDEIILSNENLGVVIATGDGGTVAEIDFRPRAFNAINSLRRRRESYHAKLRETPQQGGDRAVSIHDRVISKEPGLDRYLDYDRYNRHCFRSLVFAASRTLEDYRLGRLDEAEELAGGAFEVLRAAADKCQLARKDALSLCEVKSEVSISGSSAIADWTVTQRGLAELEAGLELVLNLLAPDAHDRYFIVPDSAGKTGALQRPRLSWAGEVRGDCIALVDEWLKLKIEVKVNPAATWWILPIYTVSQSEGGFEKVYQGSCLLPHWPVKNGELRAQVSITFSEVQA